MGPVEEHLARLKQNPGDWSARAELAHLWRKSGVAFKEQTLLSGATGAPADRAELKRLLEALDGPPRLPCWEPVLAEYVRWESKCPLGLTAMAHVLEASGKPDEALALYEKAIGIDPSLAEPALECLRKVERAQEIREAPPGLRLRDPKVVALIVAVIAHLFIIILLSFWAISSVSPRPPQMVMSALAEHSPGPSRPPSQKRVLSTISATTNMDIVAASASSVMSVAPRAPTVLTSPSIVGGTGFSPSMNFGQGSGGNVSFFGSQGKTKNLVYVVDVSGSMSNQGKNGKSRFDLMKEELVRSVSALPISVKFQIIFFSNSAWFAGQDPKVNGVIQADDPESLPTRLLIRATRSHIRKTLVQIEDAPMGGGTNWRLPLKMAIKLEPDLIYFMTDGEIDSDRGETPVIDDVVDYNRMKSNARINTICLMEIKAYEELSELARRTRGRVFLVKENGEVLQGLQIDQIR